MAAPTTTHSNVDVLIIGAGPSGLMCANALVRAGVNVRIIDKKKTKVMTGQADGVQPRTVEVLQSYGLADKLLREAQQMHMAAFYAPGPSGGIELTARTPDIISPTARYPFGTTIHQGFIESLFIDSMKEYGLEVERETFPTSLVISDNEKELSDPSAHPVTVTIQKRRCEDDQDKSETEIIHAKFVLGSDGAHSWVRKSLGIEMEGAQTEFIWGVIDFEPETDFPDIRNRCNIHSNYGSCMIIPREGNIVRLYMQITSGNALLDENGRLDKSKTGPKELLEVAKRSFQPYKFETPKEFDWWTIYNIGQRVATKFSVKNRVFISGDACHTHSPKAGQGMNASMNDTHNLAWKLAYVLRGKADLSILSTYEFERRQYAQELINFDKSYSKMFSGTPRTAANLDGVSHEEFVKAFQSHGGFTSGIAVHYGPSTITDVAYQSHATGLNIGQRLVPQIIVRAADFRPYEIQDLLPSDTRFKILVFSGDNCNDTRRSLLDSLAEQMSKSGGFLAKHGESWNTMFDILLVSTARKSNVKYNSLPPLFRRDWTKVFIDDTDVTERIGGRAYETYGIDREAGAIVIVRPDGYVGTVVPLDGVLQLDTYFDGFML